MIREDTKYIRDTQFYEAAIRHIRPAIMEDYTKLAAERILNTQLTYEQVVSLYQLGGLPDQHMIYYDEGDRKVKLESILGQSYTLGGIETVKDYIRCLQSMVDWFGPRLAPVDSNVVHEDSPYFVIYEQSPDQRPVDY